jgi:hypothetical protein
MILRRAALVAAGLAMSAGVGLAGVGTASAAGGGLTGTANSVAAAAPATKHLTPGTWTVKVHLAGCEVISIATNGTFTADKFSDSGVWAGGGNSVALSWTAGSDTGLLFSGAYQATSPVSYKGSYGGSGFGLKGSLVKGALPDC